MSIFIYLIYLPTYLTLRTFETMLPSLTHSLYAYCLSSIEEYMYLTLPYLIREYYLIDGGGRSCGGVRLLFIYGDSFLVRGERF